MANVPARRDGGARGNVPAARQRPALSRAALRRWLEANGPQPFGALLAQAELQVPGITAEEFRPHLQNHPALFTDDGGDVWSATADRPRIIRPTRFTPPPAPKRTVRSRPARRTRPEPPPDTEVWEDDGRVIGVVFPSGASVHEGGGRIRVAFPIGDPTNADLDDLVERFRQLGELEITVHERVGAGTVFRGTRSVIDIVIRSSRVEIVLAAARDDDGRALHSTAGPLRALGAGTGRGALTPDLIRDVLGGGIVLPPAGATAPLTRPAPKNAPTPDVLGALQGQIRLAGRDPGRWPAVVDRLVRELPSVDAATQDRMLAAAIRERHSPFDRLLGIAVTIHETREPDAVVAGAVVTRAGDDRALGPDLAVSALDYVGVALAAPDVSPETLLRAARIELAAAADTDLYDLAARRFLVALEEKAPLDDADLVCLAQVGALAPDIQAFEEAGDLARARLEEQGPERASADLLDALEWLASSASELNADGFDLSVELIACRIVRQEGRAALDLFRTGVLPAKPPFSDLLDVMALFEGLESRTDLEAAAGELSNLINRFGPDAAVPLLDEAIRQLQVLEELIGAGDDWSRQAVALRPAAAPPIVEASADAVTLVGVRITVVGFDPPLRRQLVTRLRGLGGDVVAEVAPSWEAHLDEQRMRAAVTGADLVIECTSQIGHDATFLLNNLAGADLGYHRLRVWGGPSAAVREALAWAGSRV